MFERLKKKARKIGFLLEKRDNGKCKYVLHDSDENGITSYEILFENLKKVEKYLNEEYARQ